MKLTDKDAGWIADKLTKELIERFNEGFGFDSELFVPEIKDGICTYKTKAGTFQVPLKGSVRGNKALDVLSKLAAHHNMPVLQVAFELADMQTRDMHKTLCHD